MSGRCKACDSRMTDRDMSRKSPHTGKYYELCNKCFKTIRDQVDAVENESLDSNVFDSQEEAIYGPGSSISWNDTINPEETSKSKKESLEREEEHGVFEGNSHPVSSQPKTKFS